MRRCSTTLWRLAWYRGGERAVGLSRVDLVEHEAFVTLLAERAGVRVPRLVTAGSAGSGDALVVVRPDGEPLAETLDDGPVGSRPTAAGIAPLWHDLRRLHDSGIVHRQLDLDRIVTHPDGSLGFGDLSSASVAEEAGAKSKDRAQLIGLALLFDDEESATTTARNAVGDEHLVAALPYIQEAAMPPLLHDSLERADVELEDVRKRMGTALGAGDQDLIKLRPRHVGLDPQPRAARVRGLRADRPARRRRHGHVPRSATRGQLVVARSGPDPRPSSAHPVGGEHDGRRSTARCRWVR